MKIFKKIRNNRGQSIVELAMILPIIIILLFGIFEFGRVFNAHMVIANASRQGARVGSVGATVTEVESTVRTNASSLTLSDLTIVVSTTGSGGRGETITVTVGYDINVSIPFVNLAVGNPVHLESAMSMRIE